LRNPDSITSPGAVTAKPGRDRRRILRIVIGYLIAAACLFWVFRGTHLERMLGQVENMRWDLVAVAIALDITSYVCQGLRWQLLLRPIGKMPLLCVTQAIYVGLFTNEIVPLRAGELVRAYLVSRWRRVDFLAVIPSVAVERLFDGIWLSIGIAVTAMLVELPSQIILAAKILGATVFALTVGFAFLVIRHRYAPKSLEAAERPLWKPIRIIRNIIARVALGIEEIGMSRYFFAAFFISAFIVIFQIVSVWLIMRAYGIHLDILPAAAVFLIIYFGTAIPNAPSNIGTYQFFAVVGLSIFGVERTTATGFSIAVFVILTATLWVIGLLAIANSGMRFQDIRKEVSQLVSRAGSA
jgi:uncharacterized protein (TIRG00374 family)